MSFKRASRILNSGAFRQHRKSRASADRCAYFDAMTEQLYGSFDDEEPRPSPPDLVEFNRWNASKARGT